MKVKELQTRLSSLDPELDVVCYTEDTSLPRNGREFLLLDIEAVDTVEAERLRLDDNTPYLKIGKSPTATLLATILVTSDF